MPEPAGHLDRGYAWVVAAISLYAVAVSMLTRFVFPVLLVLFLGEFGWSRTALSGAFSLHLLAYGVVAPWIGQAVDRWDRRLVLVAGGLGLGGTLALLPSVASVPALYLVYGLLGGASASALGLVPHTRIVAQWFVRRRGLALGLMVSGIGVAMVLVPAVQRALLGPGWRAALVTLGAVVAATVCPLAWLGQREPPGRRRPADRRAPSSWRQLGEPAFRAVALAFACFGCFAHLVIAHEVALLMDLGYGARLAGLSVAAIGVLSLAGNLGWGGVADRWGARVAAVAAFGVCLASVLALLGLGPQAPPARVAAQLLLFGVAFGTPTALSALAAHRFGGDRFGEAFGVITLVFSVGSVAGPLAAGAVHYRLGAYAWSFVMAAGVVVLGGVSAWRGAAAPRRP